MIKHLEFTHIGQSSKLSGNLKFSGKTQIEGLIEGEIHMLMNATLILGIDSNVVGRVFCHDIDIYGEINGEIDASGKVVIYPTAKINGNIKAKSLEILPGAEVNMSGHTI